MKTTLPTDSKERKDYALFSGCLRYFPAALAGISRVSKIGNDKHNPGQEMHHARNKSTDHGDCILRHLIDLEDLIASNKRGEDTTIESILIEVSSVAWRALAFSQELHEQFGAPLAPGAKLGKVDDSLSAAPKSAANEWYIAAEKAHEEVRNTLRQNKIESAKKLYSKGDVVKHINNDAEVTVEALYYDEKGTPVLFVKDADGKIFGVDPNFYRSIYVR